MTVLRVWGEVSGSCLKLSKAKRSLAREQGIKGTREQGNKSGRATERQSGRAAERQSGRAIEHRVIERRELGMMS